MSDAVKPPWFAEAPAGWEWWPASPDMREDCDTCGAAAVVWLSWEDTDEHFIYCATCRDVDGQRQVLGWPDSKVKFEEVRGRSGAVVGWRSYLNPAETIAAGATREECERETRRVVIAEFIREEYDDWPQSKWAG